jgi:RNA polymerase sigma-70 factor, ECF subfamily
VALHSAVTSSRSLANCCARRAPSDRVTRRRPHEVSLDAADVGYEVPDWGSLPDEIFESREFLTAIESALAELPPDYESAVRLRDVQGLSTTEAAEALGIGERALKSRLHRGRMALRGSLDDFFSEGYA